LSHPTLNLASDQVRNVVSVKIDPFVRFLPTLKYFIEPILNVYVFAPTRAQHYPVSSHLVACAFMTVPLQVEGNSLFKIYQFISIFTTVGMK